MHSRREFLSLVSAGAAMVAASTTLAAAQDASGDQPMAGGRPSFGPALPEHVKGATAITEVFGDGQKFTAVAVGYDAEIDTTSLSTASYSVEGRTITAVYSNRTAAQAEAGTNGRFVIIELSADDEAAVVFKSTGMSMERNEATASITQSAAIRTVAGASYAAAADLIPITSVSNLIVDDFDQRFFSDPDTGDAVEYNLFVPADYDPAKEYPLVLFMHDAGVTSTEVDVTLIQGIGGVVWASEVEQAKHEAIVLAPQFSVQVAGDAGGESSWVDTVVALVNDIAGRYNIDQSRLYTTGQSGGAMLSLAIMTKYPEFFTAAFIVAGQQDPSTVEPLANTKQWIVVAEGDENAYPTETSQIAVYEQQGTRVSRAMWSGLSTPDEFAANVAAQEAEGAQINFTVLEKGTVVPEGQEDNGGSNHINTWRIAYTIEGIRDWLFDQVK